MSEQLEVVESIAGTYSYHLRVPSQTVTLCGRKRHQFITTEVPLRAWGFRGHLRERYCSECENEARRTYPNELPPT